MADVAIVTGATTPRGLGRSIAVAFAQAGVDVAVAGRSAAAPALRAVAAEVAGLGVRSHVLLADLTDRPAVAAGVRQTIGVLGRVDYLVNNASVGLGSAVLDENDDRAWELNWAVNVRGTVSFCQAVLPHMMRRGSGSIVTIAATAGLGASPGVPYPYLATTHALVGLTKQLALEVGPAGIRANVVAPGTVNTDWRRRAHAAIAEAEGVSIKEAAAAENAAIGLRRPAEPDEIAAVVLAVALPGSSYLTGAAVPVTGGPTPGL